MSNNYIYPNLKVKITLDLEVDVNFVGMWGGTDIVEFHSIYNKMVEDGSFEELLKEKILEDLHYETFDCTNPEPFDRLCFEVKEYEENSNV